MTHAAPRRTLAALAATIAAALGACGGGDPPAARATPDPSLANLFVDTTKADNACRRSSARAAYSSSAACSSLETAYRAASQGDVVLVKAGTYGAQTVDDDGGKRVGECRPGNRAPCVTIRAAPDETVELGDLVSRGAWNVWYEGFSYPLGVDGAPSDAGPSIKSGRWVVMAGMRASGFYIASDGTRPAPQDVWIRGGEYGPRLNQCPGGGIKIGSDVSDDTEDVSLMPVNVTVEGAYIHDFGIGPACAGSHMDCIHPRDVAGYLRFLRNRFTRCQDYAILIDGNGTEPDDILIENNMVGPNASGTASIALHGGAASDTFNGSVIVRNNSADGAITPQTANTLAGVRFVGNYAASVGGCRADVSYSHNVTSDGPACGTGDAIGPITVADRPDGDFHLSGGAAAIDAGDPRDCAARDFDGEARRRGACDAGADARAPR